MNSPIVLLPPVNLTLDNVLPASPVDPVVVADSYIEGAESWTAQPWGWRTNAGGRTILNVDHHAEDARFFRFVSSGNLALQYVRAEGALPADVPALINHTDCDSILSSAILTGLLPPEDAFGDAVLAADHTGEPNAIADLLQALEHLRDIDLSLKSLRHLLNGEPLEAPVAELLKKRLDERRRARELVESGTFRMLGSVAWAQLTGDDKISGEFLTSLLPAAALIVSASLLENGRWDLKVRLGLAAPKGETLFNYGIQRWVPNFRGRWNAGSTRRTGGSPIEPGSLARNLAEAVESRKALESGNGVAR